MYRLKKRSEPIFDRITPPDLSNDFFMHRSISEQSTNSKAIRNKKRCFKNTSLRHSIDKILEITLQLYDLLLKNHSFTSYLQTDLPLNQLSYSPYLLTFLKNQYYLIPAAQINHFIQFLRKNKTLKKILKQLYDCLCPILLPEIILIYYLIINKYFSRMPVNSSPRDYQQPLDKQLLAETIYNNQSLEYLHWHRIHQFNIQDKQSAINMEKLLIQNAIAMLENLSAQKYPPRIRLNRRARMIKQKRKQTLDH